MDEQEDGGSEVNHTYDVFISYAHLDANHDVANARMIGNWLDDEGYDVWWDRDLLFGNVQKNLARKVSNAKCVIALWSPRSAKSKYVRYECRLAAKRGTLAPVILDGHPLRKDWQRFLWLDLKDFEAQKNELRCRLPPPSLKRCTAIAGLPAPTRTFIGREDELARLRQAWGSTAAGADPAQKTNVFVLHAIGGAGKSALLQEFLRPLDSGQLPGAHTVYAWSAYSQGSGDNRTANADEFIAKALRFFGHDLEQAPIKDHVERGRRLAQLVAERRALLILDGLEPLQDAPHINDGRLKDRGLAEFIKTLARANKGLLLITSRQELPELAQAEAPRIISDPLDRMGTGEAVKLLAALGVDGKRAELEHAVEEVLGHALSLNLLGSYLSAVHGGDVNQREQFRLGEAEALPAKFVGDATKYYAKRAANILERTVEHLKALEADGGESAILDVVGLFDRPAEREALVALLAGPAIPGLTEAFHGLSAAQCKARWNVAVERLRKLKLLVGEDRHQPGALEAHPIIRAHFAGRLKARAPEAYREAHSRLYDYYRYLGLPKEFHTPEAYGLLAYKVAQPNGPIEQCASQAAAGELTYENAPLAPPSFYNANPSRMREATALIGTAVFDGALEAFLPSSLEGMRPCFAAIVHGCAAGWHQEAFDEVYLPRVRRGDEHFVNAKLGALNANLMALTSFLDARWGTPASGLRDTTKARVLAFAAFALRTLGRLRESIEPFKASLKANASAQDWKEAALDASNASEAHLILGDIGEALSAAGSSVVYADDSGDVFQRMARRTMLADVLHQGGKAREAMATFTKARAIQTEEQPFLQMLTSLRGYRYCDFLIASGHLQSAIKLAGSNLKVLGELYGLFGIALDNLIFGRAHAALALEAGQESDEPLAQAQTYLDIAVDRLRRASTDYMLPAGLLARAAHHRAQSAFPAAAADLAEALDIASRGEMRLHLTDYHLETARLLLAQLADGDTALRGEAETHIDIAAALVKSIGYNRRQSELAALRACLDGHIPAHILAPDRDAEGRPTWHDLPLPPSSR